MSRHICKKCNNNHLNQCTYGFYKTDDQIIGELYSCFSERKFEKINMGSKIWADMFRASMQKRRTMNAEVCLY